MAALEDLSPSYFALVMATGIVSIGCKLMGLELLAVGLFAINIVAYLVLWVLRPARLRFHPKRVLAT